VAANPDLERITTMTPAKSTMPSPGGEVVTVGRNRLLGALPPEDIGALAPYLAETSMEQGAVLQEPGQPVKRIYFPCSGLVSLVGMLPEGHEIETGVIGREGAIGLMAAMGSQVALTRAVVQLPSLVIHAPAGRVAEVAERSRTLRALMARYADILTAQVQQTAVCNTVHPIQARVCRWLLLARDRTGSDRLAVTQEFLSGLLGVQRTTITVVSRILQNEGIVHVRRGHIQIRDPQGLERRACGCHRAVRRLIDQVGREPMQFMAAPAVRAGFRATDASIRQADAGCEAQGSPFEQ